MVVVTLEIECNTNGDPNDVASEIQNNLRDTLGHCPYGASISLCYGESAPDKEDEDE